MTITAINGSPKGEISNSREVINILASMLPSTTNWNIISRIPTLKDIQTYQFDDLRSSEVLFLSFPLYVDAIPGSLMHFLAAYENFCRSQWKGDSVQRVFAVSNCGFHEGQQNSLALEVISHFCASAGLLWCGGAGIGTGEMILGMKSVPPEAGIRKPVTNAIQSLARAIEDTDGKLEKNIFTQHAFPWFLYKIAGEMGWRKMLKRNGLSRKAIAAQPLLIK